MLKSIRFENFLSFKNSKIELEKQPNILIGINGSGKTNFLKAIRLLYDGITGTGLKNQIVNNLGGFENIYFSDIENEKNDSKYIVLEYEFDKDVVSNFGYNFKDDFFYKLIIYKNPGFSNYYITEKIYVKKQGKNDFIYLEFNNGKGYLFGKSDDRNLVQDSNFDLEFIKNLEFDDYNECSIEKQNAQNINSNYHPNLGLIKYQDFDPQESALSQVSDPERFYIQDTIKKAIKESIVYFYFDTSPFSKIRNAVLPTLEKRLLTDGRNLAQILHTIRMNFRADFKILLSRLNDVNENYSDVNFNLVGTNIELVLEEKKINKVIHVSNISDGTLYYLCLLSIFYNPQRGKLICIDEPETGLHPDMMRQITNAIQESGKKTQFIIATHSENILNAFNIENIRVFEKNEKNETMIFKFSEKDFEGWYDKFSVGQMWRQGDFGGNRW
ncbi:MAG: AAA family ATPase [Candidatus Cloacimonetes bacterium]|nr:AAA family ATPase [Candidatus Cloacimonadota bacterium]